MAGGNSNKTAYAVVAIVIIALVLVFSGVIDPSSLTLGRDQGGVQEPPTQPTPTTGTIFTGQLLIGVTHRDALDNSESRTEGTNITTVFYKSNDAVVFNSIGTASTTAGNTQAVTVDAGMNSVVWVSPQVQSGQAYFIAPNAISDPNLNPRVLDFLFVDVTADGQKEWIFKIDLRDMPAPVAGQTGSTFFFNILSYDDGASTLSAPADITGVGTTAGTQTFIRWEQTVGQETSDPVYEYEIQINGTDTAKWDRGRSILSAPNLGDLSLSDFAESQDGTNTTYKFTLGSTLEKANYVTTPQNGNAVHPIPFKIVTNFASADVFTIQLTLRSMTSAQGTASVSDTVQMTEA